MGARCLEELDLNLKSGLNHGLTSDCCAVTTQGGVLEKTVSSIDPAFVSPVVDRVTL